MSSRTTNRRTTENSVTEDLSGDLIKRFERLDASIPWTKEIPAKLQIDASCAKDAGILAETASYSYCFEDDISLDSFKGWSGMNWVKNQGLQILSVRKLHQSAVITMFGSRQDKDAAIKTEVALIRGSSVVHYSWALECENKDFRPKEEPV
ncbi:hypothetical protein R1flu_016550 [Riccia fluitans]|uniref:BRCT domain-containing protein n=1 Tax=Riccia fluitans TaxID=41844 RepID=A0ABD1YM56_9MARC